MNNDDNNEYEIINNKGGKLANIGINTKEFMGNIVNKISDLPSFARDLLKSTEKSEEIYTDLAKQDKNVIEMVITEKVRSGNYTNEELEALLNRTEKITEKQAEILDKGNNHKKEIFLLLSGCLIVALKAILESRNNKA